LAAEAGPGLLAAFEVPPVPASWAPILDSIHRAGGVAKLRTGGVAPSAIPTTRLVAAFIWQCVSTGVPFKATAGLHHPVRGEHPLTYEAGSATAMMHGLLNVFVAAALAYQLNRSGEASNELALDLLDRLVGDTDVSAFRVSASSVSWRDHHFEPELLRHVRSEVALSFGSCSFNEPVEDLQALGIGLAVPGGPGNRS
jgi:hypothetical protein